ncbi:UV-B-induced protein At3g17800, chloroplastic-like [Lolium rigidum]|uniref:UV-B-induced protein At3g17800, chloroplastic-like n=1 Tax=Lolium rigidum TaxID=89674 RepID=UPI001F5DA6FE|nr:UV-B-induced protein At3g17800, chloroplastic-like [Lolium rigidum]
MEATAAAAAAALRSPTAAAAPSRRVAGARSLPFERRRSFALGSVKGLGRQQLTSRRRSSLIRASSSPSESLPSSSPIAPLQMESPIGQFLSQILVTHPHLLPAAAEQQLEQLQTVHDAAGKEGGGDKPAPPPGGDIVLYRRIAEVKEKERRRTTEEILYALVVQKFVEAGVSLVPALSHTIDTSGRVDQWGEHVEGKLERLHSQEAYEMIENHLNLILGQRQADATVAAISKLRVGQVYAASVMYGYFLKRVDQRFQLEKSMKNLPWGSEDALNQVMTTDSRPSAQTYTSHPEVEESWTSSDELSAQGLGQSVKPCRLKSYVMSFDPDTLQTYATIRSKVAFGIIEKHTEALFGKPEIVITPEGTVDSSKDEHVRISFSGLRRLILEAVTFGSFLWDVESYVDSRYHFVTN